MAPVKNEMQHNLFFFNYQIVTDHDHISGCFWITLEISRKFSQQEISAMTLSPSSSLLTASDAPRLVSCGEKCVETLLTADGARSEATVSQYVQSVICTYDALKGSRDLPTDIGWIESRANAIVTVLEAKYPNKGSLASKLTPLLVICRLKEWKEAYEIFFKAFLNAKHLAKSKVSAISPNAVVGRDEVLSKVKDLGRTIRRYLVPRVDSGDVLARDEVKTVFQHLVLVAYILEPQKGRSWAELPIQRKDGSFSGSFASAAFTVKGKALRENGDGTFSLILCEKGRSEGESARTYPLTARFCHYLKRSIKLVPRGFFLICTRNMSLAISENNLSRFVADIPFSGGKSLTINHLQHLFPDQHKGGSQSCDET